MNAQSPAAGYDAVVIGAGFFGCNVALILRERAARVLLVEKADDICTRASYANQARVHGGYHYPRSILTGVRSRANLPQFVREYEEVIDRSVTHHYAIARKFSQVTAEQFRIYCGRISAPLRESPGRVQRLFDPNMIEAVFQVEEYVFDADRLAAIVRARLVDAEVDLRLGTEAVRVGTASAGLASTLRDAQGTETVVESTLVFNCTYSATNAILANSGLEQVSLQYELTELALVRPAPQLQGLALTVMCGPFFSLMPFPARDAYTLSHVRYTPHYHWERWDPRISADELRSRRSRFPEMLRDAKRYIPTVAGCTYLDSLWEIKMVLPRFEFNDSRPILFKRHRDLPGLISIVGGKIDNIFDLSREIEAVAAQT